jgi:hypothetical protein
MTPPGDGGPELLPALVDVLRRLLDHMGPLHRLPVSKVRGAMADGLALIALYDADPRASSPAALQTETDRWEKQARMMAIVADRHKAHAALLDAILLTLRPNAENVARLYEKVKDTQSQVWRLLRVIDGEIRDHLGLEQEEDT